MNPNHVLTRATPTSRWFRTIKASSAPDLRLVCFPHAGGTANFFRTWAHLIPDGVELMAVQYPAREARFLDAPAETMEELVAELSAASVDLFDVPIIFFGHSMGASIAYELAVHLRAEQGRALDGLFVSGREGPGGKKKPGLAEVSDRELIAALTDMGGTETEVLLDPSLRELVLPAIRADYRLLERYEAHAPRNDFVLDVPIVAYYGIDDADLDRDAVMAWSAATQSDFHARAFEGGHFYLIDEVHNLLADLFARQRILM
ncbi:thioesterase II family protein [Streptomyces sp. NPDC059582]|uniref:thioesterase II family protein n=1 Tax=Streptomyces sp. NPDC059582 TaxID=3346875 RepID=UPI0036C56ADE